MAGSKDEVYQIVRSMGVPAGTSVAEWVAVAGAESSFRSDVVNDNSSATGYWQIVRSNWGGNTQTQMKNGRINFQRAKVVWQSQGWRAWKATDGNRVKSDNAFHDRYGERLAADFIAEHAGQSASVTSPGDLLAGAAGLAESLDPVAGLVGPISAVASTVQSTAKWLGDPHNWTRIVWVVGGTLVGLAGASMILKETDAGKAVVKAATKGAL